MRRLANILDTFRGDRELGAGDGEERSSKRRRLIAGYGEGDAAVVADGEKETGTVAAWWLR